MEPDAVLDRLDHGAQGMFGRFVAGRLSVYSGELSWRDNAPSISCVPPAAGSGESRLYRCEFTDSPRFGRLLYLVGPVPGRAGIRVHPANLMGIPERGFRRQLNGCIALGERLGWMDRQKALLLSGPACRRVEEHFAGKPFVLEIRDALQTAA